MVKGTHRGSVKDGGAARSETSRRATAPRRQPPHGVGTRWRESPSLTPCGGRRLSPSVVAQFLSKKGKYVRRKAGLSRARRCNRLGSVILTLDELRQMTGNFSDDQLLGEGAFGKVYKGVLKNGDMIAVKRFTSPVSGLQDVQYENEAQHLMRLKHRNIVQLVGYCSETEIKLVPYNGNIVSAEKTERLLCLEYMPKGSLRDHLSDESSGLDWNTRYRIIEGICYGLHYLHEELQNTPVIHRDLKPANILLDDNMVPKIADFGLSRLFSEEQTRTCTTSCKGTPGYMAPEYIEKGVISKKFDIFSLGVIIIEIITGLKDYPTVETQTTSEQYIDQVLNNWRHRLRKAQGHTSQDIDYEQIKKCIRIGLLCVKFDWMKRPTINQIIKMLERSDEAYQNERECFGREANQERIAADESNTNTRLCFLNGLEPPVYTDDKPNEKRHPPRLDDDVYHLEEISRDGAYHRRLQEVQIYKVEGFLKALNQDSNKLRAILKMENQQNAWSKLTEHARECVLEDRQELKRYHSKEGNVVFFFNCVYELVGAAFPQEYVACQRFNTAQKALVNNWRCHAYEKLKDISPDFVLKGNFPVPISSRTDVAAAPSVLAVGASQQFFSADQLVPYQDQGTGATEYLAHHEHVTGPVSQIAQCGPSIPNGPNTRYYQGTGTAENVPLDEHETLYQIADCGPNVASHDYINAGYCQGEGPLHGQQEVISPWPHQIEFAGMNSNMHEYSSGALTSAQLKFGPQHPPQPGSTSPAAAPPSLLETHSIPTGKYNGQQGVREIVNSQRLKYGQMTTEGNITPIYGRGNSGSDTEKVAKDGNASGPKIPPRPHGNRLPISRRLGEAHGFLSSTNAHGNLAPRFHQGRLGRMTTRFRPRRFQRELENPTSVVSSAPDSGQPRNNTFNVPRCSSSPFPSERMDLMRQSAMDLLRHIANAGLEDSERFAPVVSELRRIANPNNTSDLPRPFPSEGMDLLRHFAFAGLEDSERYASAVSELTKIASPSPYGASTSSNPPYPEPVDGTHTATALAADQDSNSSTIAVIEEDAAFTESAGEPSNAGHSRSLRRRGSDALGSLDVDGGDLHQNKRRQLK